MAARTRMGYYTPRRTFRRWRRRRNFFPKSHRRQHFRRRRYYPRRRFWHRRSTEVLREHRPRKQKHITVYGWEILGHCGTTWFWTDKQQLQYRQNIKNNQQVSHLADLGILTSNAKPNFPHTQKTKCEFKSFCGGYGQATITMSGLAERARLGMARFSETFEGYTWIKFLGASFQLVPAEEVDYVFKLNNRAPYKTDEEKKAETKWNHPANLLLHRGVRVVESIKRSKCCKWKRIRYKPPTEFEGWYDIENFVTFQLVQYMWSTISLNNPLGIPPYGKGTLDKSSGAIHNDWWNDGCKDPNSNLPIPIWMDRETYDTAFLTNDNTKWWDNVFGTNKPKHSPFCPPIFTTTHPNTLWCRYKFWFKVGGTTLQNFLPLYPVQEIGPPPSKCASTCEACIKEGDLDSSGLLTESSLRRITGTDHSRRRRLLEKLRRTLHRVLKKRRGSKSVHWGKRQTRYFSE